MSFLLVSFLFAATTRQQVPEVAPSPMSPIEEADVRFALRAVGAKDGVADRAEADAAIDLYRKAVAAAPDDIEVLAKLLRALHFRGAYTGAGIEEKKQIFEEGRRLGQDAVDRIDKGAKSTPGLTRIEALRKIKGAPLLYLWTAGHWGEWALVRGKFAAARSGIASRLRDLAQSVIDIDPVFEDAAGYRILGRLHAEAPRIPFITGWVSHDKGVQFLRRAYEIAPNHPVTWYFLAEAILDHDPSKADEAKRLLEKCASTPPRPDTVLEDSHYARMARKLLDELKTAN